MRGHILVMHINSQINWKTLLVMPSLLNIILCLIDIYARGDNQNVKKLHTEKICKRAGSPLLTLLQNMEAGT